MAITREFPWQYQGICFGKTRDFYLTEYTHVIAMSVLVLNLRKIQCAILRLLTYLLAIFLPKEKWTIVQ